MKIHIQQIPADGLHLEAQEPNDILNLEDPSIVPLENVHYALDVGISGSSLHVTGRLWADLELECGSCLQRFVYPLAVNDFAAQYELTGPEVVDLTPAMREDMLLALPPYPRCDWDGKTVCPGPRADLLPSGDVPSTVNAWDALNELKLKRKS
jgi:uncharacterized protein